MSRILVAFGANAGLVGLFLPVARVADRLSRGDRHYDVRIWGGFDAADFSQVVGFVMLGFFLVLGLLGLWMMAAEVTRAKALVTLLFAIPAEAIAIWVLAFHLASIPGDAKAGPGLVLMCVGGGMIVVGSLWGVVRPDAARREDAAPGTPPNQDA